MKKSYLIAIAALLAGSLTAQTIKKAHTISANGHDDRLIFYCTFDDEEAIASPVAGQPVKLELGQLCPGKCKNSGALLVNPGIAGAEVQLPQGTLGAEGCIEFWANMAICKARIRYQLTNLT